jgi:hypothetical protein
MYVNAKKCIKIGKYVVRYAYSESLCATHLAILFEVFIPP